MSNEPFKLNEKGKSIMYEGKIIRTEDAVKLLNTYNKQYIESKKFIETTLNIIQKQFNICAEQRKKAGSNILEQTFIKNYEQLLKEFCKKLEIPIEKEYEKNTITINE